MEQVIEKFGLNIQLLIAQIINFGVLFFVLYKLVYKPVLKNLDQRKNTIEHSLAQAKEIEEKTKKIDGDIAMRLCEAKQQTIDMIGEAKEIGEKTRAEILFQANKEVSEMVQKAKNEIHQEKESMMQEVKEYVVKTSLHIVEKIFNEKIDTKMKEKLILESFRDISHSS